MIKIPHNSFKTNKKREIRNSNRTDLLKTKTIYLTVSDSVDLNSLWYLLRGFIGTAGSADFRLEEGVH